MDIGLDNRPFSRNRRKMFSVSIMASSTTSPKAIAKPPNTIIFKLTPVSSSTITAPMRETGIAKAEINAVRKLYKNRYKTIRTNKPPISKCPDKFVKDRSI